MLSLGFFAQSGQSQLLWPGFWQVKHFTLPEDFLSSLNMVNAVSMRRPAASTNSSVVVTDELDTSPHSTSQEQLKIVPGWTQHTSIQALSTLPIMLLTLSTLSWLVHFLGVKNSISSFRKLGPTLLSNACFGSSKPPLLSTTQQCYP